MDFRVLGPLQVTDGARTVGLGGPMQRAVLALLVLDPNRVVSVERLIDGLWGDEPPARATGTVQAYVSNLRRSLEPDRPQGVPARVLASRVPGYVLQVGPDDVDWVRFERLFHRARQARGAGDLSAADAMLVEARALWRGPPLADLGGIARPERVWLDGLRLGAVEEHAQVLLAQGRHDEALDDLVAVAAEHPLRERLRGLQMTALYRAGRQVEALEVYTQVRRQLTEEHGLDPGADLRALHERVLRQDPQLAPTRPAPSPAAPRLPGAPAPLIGRATEVATLRAHLDAPQAGTGRVVLVEGEPGVGKARLLERERELRVIGDALAEAQEGRGRVVLVEAVAGLGKTSLLREACDGAAATGFACLRARASELERDFAYGCVRQLLEPVVANASEPERQRLFDGAASLSEPLFSPTAPSPSSSADSTFSVLHGLYWLLNNLAAERALALSLDDLHWSDPASLRFIAYLAPRLDGLPLVVFASTRPGEGDTVELARLAAAPETGVIRPGPLSSEATAALCERTLGVAVAPEFAAACREATGGNPFFLEALLREAREEGIATDARGADGVRHISPAAVAQAVLLRLSGAPAAATRLVRAVAVLGDGTSIDEAARLAELSEGEAPAAADLLAKLGLLRPAAGLEFAHPIVREAVYADVGPRETAAAHARAAEILTRAGAAEERIAAQLAKAEPTGDGKRVELLRRVADGALVQGAPVAAVALLRRALAEPPARELRGQVLLELGAAELRLGAPKAIDHLAEAVELISEPSLLTTAVRTLANAVTFSGQSDRAVHVIESAIEVVESGDRELALLLEAELAAHAQQARLETRAPAARRLERRGDVKGATSGERLVMASLAFERARASESAAEAATYLEAGLAGGRLLREQQLDVAGPFYHLVIGLLATDALHVLDECLEQALADARARASIPAVAYATAYLGRVALRRGALTRAQADLQAALDLLTGHGIAFGIEPLHGLLAQAMLGQGKVKAAEQTLRSGGLELDIPPGLTSNLGLEARGMLRLAQGRTREGLADLGEFGHREEMWGGANPLATRWRSHASYAYAALGDREQARRLASDDLDRARRWGAASGVGVALRAHALVARESPDGELLREAVGVLGRSPVRLEQAHALTDLGGALRRANRRAEAQASLQDALALAERCGARALAEHARTELRAPGGRSNDPQGSGAQRLTVSERRVAELAAEGLNNPKIAQTLFVTRKTVETHLGHIYRKLDIPGRGALGRALTDADSRAGD